MILGVEQLKEEAVESASFSASTGPVSVYVYEYSNPYNGAFSYVQSAFGLCKSGEQTAQEYLRQLRGEKLWLLTHPWSGYRWSMNGGRDLVSSRDTFAYRGRELTGPQQGNVNAAYAFTRAFGNPMAGVVVSLLGEVPGLLAGVSSLEDARGSFEANALGIWEGTKDLTPRDLVHLLPIEGAAADIIEAVIYEREE